MITLRTKGHKRLYAEQMLVVFQAGLDELLKDHNCNNCIGCEYREVCNQINIVIEHLEATLKDYI